MKTIRDIAELSFLNAAQLRKVEEIMLADGFYPEATIRRELDAFTTGLGMSEFYFRTTPLETIAHHIEALRAAEILATLRKEEVVRIDFQTEHENDALYLIEEDNRRGVEIEQRIEDKYPHYRLQSYRTLRKARGLQHLRMYVVYKPQYPAEKAGPDETDIHKIGDKTFLSTVPQETVDRYEGLLRKAKGWESPLIDVTPVPRDKELRISVVTRTDASPRFFSNVSDVINCHGLFSKRKYIEHFGNGRTIYTFYLDEIKSREKLQDLIEDISLIYVIPESPLSSLFREGVLSAQEFVFANSAWSFAHQFLGGYNEEYLKLADALKGSPELLGILRDLKVKLARETYTESRCWEAFLANPGLVRKLFALFDRKFNPALKDPDIKAGLAALRKDIQKTVQTEADRNIFQAACLFVDIILKTNFYVREKVAISFMYRPDFLDPVDYPVKPFGVFHIIGRELRGFHIRFRDIARGGIRIVRSANLQGYLANSDLIFDENYNLALTQQRKNKDLPDGGSKGTILLRWGFQDRPEAAFKKYIDGLLDLMLPDPGVVDYCNREIILFLGPDEGTAELMEWGRVQGQGPRLQVLEGVHHRQAGDDGRHPPRPLRHDDDLRPRVRRPLPGQAGPQGRPDDQGHHGRPGRRPGLERDPHGPGEAPGRRRRLGRPLRPGRHRPEGDRPPGQGPEDGRELQPQKALGGRLPRQRQGHGHRPAGRREGRERLRLPQRLPPPSEVQGRRLRPAAGGPPPSPSPTGPNGSSRTASRASRSSSRAPTSSSPSRRASGSRRRASSSTRTPRPTREA